MDKKPTEGDTLDPGPPASPPPSISDIDTFSEDNTIDSDTSPLMQTLNEDKKSQTGAENSIELSSRPTIDTIQRKNSQSSSNVVVSTGLDSPDQSETLQSPTSSDDESAESPKSQRRREKSSRHKKYKQCRRHRRTRSDSDEEEEEVEERKERSLGRSKEVHRGTSDDNEESDESSSKMRHKQKVRHRRTPSSSSSEDMNQQDSNSNANDKIEETQPEDMFIGEDEDYMYDLESGEYLDDDYDLEPTEEELLAFQKLENSVTWTDLGIYFGRQFLAQIQAVIPVSIYFSIYLAIVFKEVLKNILPLLGGLVLVIVGLTFFLEGLKIFFMPLSERIGWKLPQKFPLLPVLTVVTMLGILCTYAEPAISALVPLGDLVAPYESPYLFWIMNPWRPWLVLSIGVGIGLSILIGTLRLLKNWQLKPMIYITLAFAVGPAIYLQWVNPHLRKLVPLAWDIGVVATGPVTVPITLALGNGIARSNPVMAKNPLAGFGLVALASLYPIITVQALMMFLSFLYSRDELLLAIEILLNKENTTVASKWDSSPYLELINSLRAILPLAGMLLAILVVAIRQELPEISWYQILKADREARGEKDPEGSPVSTEPEPASQSSSDDLSTIDEEMPNNSRRRVSFDSRYDQLKTYENEFNGLQDALDREDYLNPKRHSLDIPREYSRGNPRTSIDTDGKKSIAIEPDSSRRVSLSGNRRTSMSGRPNRTSIGSRPSRTSFSRNRRPSMSRENNGDVNVEMVEVNLDEAEANIAQTGPIMTKLIHFKRTARALFMRHSVFIVGLISVQIGCLLFNWGIVYGLSPLSLQVGGWLPAAYMHVNGLIKTPRFAYAVGVLLILIFGFLLGALVTLAEPGMAVFCRQVESLTNGDIATPFLIATVSVGVGGGLAIGLLTLVFHVPTIYIVLGGYPLAVLMTVITPNSGLAAVAWDAAGTVTGPVTTPLVLSIGLAFGKRDPHVDGFGILTCAAIFPIISVLVVRRMLDTFTELKKDARLIPAGATTRGVLSATLRWDHHGPAPKLATIGRAKSRIDMLNPHLNHH